MNKNPKPKRHRLKSGVPCCQHSCVECCLETMMPLSNLDMKRISSLGYCPDDFAVKTAEGRQLRNNSGRCVFLSDSGCNIYPYRPEGCRLYPLVYQEALGKAVLDDLCPYRVEFKVTVADELELRGLIERVESEKQIP